MPHVRLWTQLASKRIKRSAKKGNYQDFFDVKALAEFAFATADLPTMPTENSLDRLLLQLRLTTLMRSSDAAQIVWGVFHHDSRWFIKVTDKMSTLITFSVKSDVLDTLLVYMERFIEHPAPFLFRYVAEPSKCLQSERLAKRVKLRMAEVGIDVGVFKAHALRGATATRLLRNGM